MKEQTHGAWPPLQPIMQQPIVAHPQIFPANVPVIPIIRLDPDNPVPLDMGFKDTVAGSSTIAHASGIEGLNPFFLHQSSFLGKTCLNRVPL